MIKFAVNGQRLLVDTPIIVAGTYNYLTADFTFSADWTAAKKIAHFELGDELHDIELHDDKIVEADGLNLPAGDWIVSVTGWVIADGAVTKQITTSSCIVRVVGKNPGFAPLEPSLAERITADAMAVRTGAEAAQRAAETARDDARGYVEQAKTETAEIVRQAQEAVSETVATDLTAAETELAQSKDAAIADIATAAGSQRESVTAEGTRQINAVKTAGDTAAEKSETAQRAAEDAQSAAAASAAAAAQSAQTAQTKAAEIAESAGQIDENKEDISRLFESITEISEAQKKWIRLDGVKIKDGTDIVPTAIEKGEHGFYARNGSILPVVYDGYKYYKIPVDGDGVYYLDKSARWCFTTDADGNVVDTTDNTDIETFITTENAVLLWCTYNSNVQPYRMIAKGGFPKETVYEIPSNVIPQVSFSDLSGKLTSDMVDGYEKGNLNTEMKLVQKNAYAYVGAVGNRPIISPSDGFDVYSLEVEPTQYTFLESRFILPLDETGRALAIQTNNATSFDNTELKAKTIYFSFHYAQVDYKSIDKFEISKGTEIRTKDTLPKWTGVDALDSRVDALDSRVDKGIVSKTGSLSANGQYIVLGAARTNLRKGIRLVFEATVTSGTDFEIGFSISESSDYYGHNIIGVTSDNISYNGVSYPHGLNIADRLQMIFEYLSNATADVTLICNGNAFKKNIPFVMESVAVPYVKSKGLVSTECKFTFICSDVRKKIWIFGDSYFAYSDNRWTYYLKEYGYDKNVLIDGWPGMGGANGRTSFAKLVKLGKPQCAVWFLGMNDGTDVNDTTPNANWKSNVDIFVSLCEENGVTPIFATIPNVPNINHKGKNAWIKSSGYRYIDMCHAVGADVTTNWYGDMLSSDRIHPSESGAKALFAQVLLDLPEVMIDNL